METFVEWLPICRPGIKFLQSALGHTHKAGRALKTSSFPELTSVTIRARCKMLSTTATNHFWLRHAFCCTSICQRTLAAQIMFEKTKVEMPGIEPGTFHMRSERSTTELHPLIGAGGCQNL